MRFEVDIPDTLVQAIAAAVVDRLRPVILGLTAPPAKADGLMSVDELAAHLGGVSRDWIYQRTSKNEIPFVKVGRLLKFDRAAIDKWRASRAVPDIASLSAPLSADGRGIAYPEARQNQQGTRAVTRGVK